MSLSVIVAYFAANRIAPSVYKVMLLVHETPHMGDMSKKLKSVPIGRVVGGLTSSMCVHGNFTVGDIVELLRKYPHMDWFPVVDVLNREYIMPVEGHSDAQSTDEFVRPRVDGARAPTKLIAEISREVCFAMELNAFWVAVC